MSAASDYPKVARRAELERQVNLGRKYSDYTNAITELDTLRFELAALKARRCDGCAWYVPDPAFMSPESAFGTCAMPHSGPTPEPPVSLYMDGEPIRVDVLVDADHACNAWEAWPRLRLRAEHLPEPTANQNGTRTL